MLKCSKCGEPIEKGKAEVVIGPLSAAKWAVQFLCPACYEKLCLGEATAEREKRPGTMKVDYESAGFHVVPDEPGPRAQITYEYSDLMEVYFDHTETPPRMVVAMHDVAGFYGDIPRDAFVRDLRAMADWIEKYGKEG